MFEYIINSYTTADKFKLNLLTNCSRKQTFDLAVSLIKTCLYLRLEI